MIHRSRIAAVITLAVLTGGLAYIVGNYNDTDCAGQNESDNDSACGKFSDSSDTAAELKLNYSPVTVKGNADAPVTVVEFSDFLCEYCRKAAAVLESVMNKFPGSVRLVFINYPLENTCNRALDKKFHEGACLLAQGSVCSARQGKFAEYLEAAFSMKMKSAGRDELRRLAILSGINMNEFESCLNRDNSGELEKQMAQAKLNSIESVPAVFINGKRIDDWKDEAKLVRMVEREVERGR